MSEILHDIVDVTFESITISGFVLVMMLIIEYLNTYTKGAWNERLQNSIFLQLFFSAVLGLIPGCLGTYITVSLYTHQIIRFGSLLASLIASTGDEGFVMYSMAPGDTVLLNIVLFGIAISVGWVFNTFFKNLALLPHKKFHFEIHHEEIESKAFDWKVILQQLKNISFPRALIVTGIVLFVLKLAIAGEHAGDHGGEHGEDHHLSITNMLFMLVSGVALFIVVTVSDHFLEAHLWGHVIKKHLPKIFLWTFAALFVIHLSMEYLDIEQWIKNKEWVVLLAAMLIGIIPESGPNLIFTTLYAGGSISFGVWLANSIVQDGHAGLPLLAESKKSFIIVKLIKLVIAFVAGAIGIIFY